MGAVIDDPIQVSDLIHEMRAVLPLRTWMSSRLLDPLADRPASSQCWIVGVEDFTDAGGIMCVLPHAPDDETAEKPVISLTLLEFGARSPGARAIAAYKKRRIRQLRAEHMLKDLGIYDGS